MNTLIGIAFVTPVLTWLIARCLGINLAKTAFGAPLDDFIDWMFWVLMMIVFGVTGLAALFVW